MGDIEYAPFVEAMRQFQFRVGHENFFLIHVSLIPIVGSVGEQKTKPTQASIRDLRGLGLAPDVIACRSARALDEGIQAKISMYDLFFYLQPVIMSRTSGLTLRISGFATFLQSKYWPCGTASLSTTFRFCCKSKAWFKFWNAG